MLNLAEAILIAQLSPILMAIAAVLVLGERLTAWRIGGVALGFLGVIVLVWPELADQPNQGDRSWHKPTPRYCQQRADH